jgi:hypothetical protein
LGTKKSKPSTVILLFVPDPILSADVTAVLASAFDALPDAFPAMMMEVANVVATFKVTRILLTTILQALPDATPEKTVFELRWWHVGWIRLLFLGPASGAKVETIMAAILCALFDAFRAPVMQEALVVLTIVLTVGTAVLCAFFDAAIHRAALNLLAVC